MSCTKGSTLAQDRLERWPKSGYHKAHASLNQSKLTKEAELCRFLVGLHPLEENAEILQNAHNT
eukprot:2080086-Amphidinium_carterae.1